jgi:galactose-1-phosphate uridylyltransferase
MKKGQSVLFPNLFPYGKYSAVSLIDKQHFVEIGSASLRSYTDSFLNCILYLKKIRRRDPHAPYMAITQNHLPSAGGSLLHPHLQVHADCVASNHQRFLQDRANSYYRDHGSFLFSDYLRCEKESDHRFIGNTGSWEWLAAYAPEGFFEIWGIFPEATSFFDPDEADWKDLTRGLINVQKFYRSLCRNGYNLGIISVEGFASRLELRIVLMVRSNYAAWVRNDHTGFETMLGDMATFNPPEMTADLARPFWSSSV